MSNHYYVTTLFVALICIAMTLGVGSCTSSRLAEMQQIDTTFMVKVRVYQDSVKNDPQIPLATKARFDTLYRKWDEAFVQQQKAVYKAQEVLNQNLTIWLSIIAAICTILPIVLAMNQSNSLRTQLDLYSQELEHRKDEFRKKMGKSIRDIEQKKDEVERQVKTYQSDLCHTEVIALLNMLSQNLSLLCNLQEIENKENPILTSPNLVKVMIWSFKDNVEKCQAKFIGEQQHLEGKSLNSIQNALMSTLCSVRDMAYLYENVFNGINLIKLQRLRDDLSFYMLEKVSTLKVATAEDVKESFVEISKAAKCLKVLFDTLEDE